MKKLTAGLFTVWLGLVSVGMANASVVSTTYLDEVLDIEMARKQDVLDTTDSLVTISEDNKINVVTGAVSEQGTNLVTAADIYAALNQAVAKAQNTLQQGIEAKADSADLQATDVKVAANEAAIAKEVSDRDNADKALQANIDLKANSEDVTGVTYSGTNYLNETIGLKAATIALDAQVRSNAETIAILEGGENAEGSIKNLTAQITENKAAITKLNETAATVGSVANSITTALDKLDYEDAAVSGQFVTSVSEQNGVIVVSRAELAAADIPVIAISQVDGLQAALDAKQVALTNRDGAIVISQDGVISVAAQGITSTMIKDGAINEDKLASDSVTSTKIKDGAINEYKLASDSVTSTKIKDGAITAGKIADGAVGVGQLADSVNSLLTGAIQAPSETSADGTFVLTAKKVTNDGVVSYTYAWEDIAGRE